MVKHSQTIRKKQTLLFKKKNDLLGVYIFQLQNRFFFVLTFLFSISFPLRGHTKIKFQTFWLHSIRVERVLRLSKLTYFVTTQKSFEIYCI